MGGTKGLCQVSISAFLANHWLQADANSDG